MFNILALVDECSGPGLSQILLICKKALNLIQMLGPIILIIALALNFTKLMSNPDDKKSLSKLKNSFLAAVILFFVPVCVNVVMYMLDDSFSISNCWNNLGDYSGTAKYINPNKKKGSSLLIDPDDYEKGEERKQDSTSGGNIEGTAQSVGDVVWDSSDVTKISNLTSTQLIAILNAHGGNAKNFIPYASGLITAENKHQVNVFFLLGIEALESGWVTSSISQNCNNFGGVCASSAHPSNGCGSNSNCNFAYFNSGNEFIDYHARMLHTNYLTPGGSYYHGTSPQAVVTNYCPGCSSWPSSVISIANSLFSKVSSVI